ncbi:MAG TPA: DmsC/YnfH family molybdoenzyme membrane anchor subunit [Ramlibacter sp.]|uniref:dimethyl sulfoxide reductase anchor subunit family protein n=1 Tax=Ramlibacter sp. TaxID=1917967 RepID=UPI002CC4D78E|nr:DmsC/YnfH family molybdoenzyme membrane anchor subunit [Ramlibacter sp.]HVZ46338.1 DmsC/YnfH family molybdoenzyme membrane anchor subunit [Ramlibacter sp.]
MKPAFSIIFFTTLAGAAQGLAVTLAVAMLAGAMPQGAAAMLWIATGTLVLALAASFFHLGHPLRAWRAALMWRTSWMSREVIVLPAFIAVTAAWALALTFAAEASVAANVLPWLAIALALLLWYCTAMIYACIRFIQEWAHPLTIVNYLLLGLASGLVAACALAAFAGDATFAAATAKWAIGTTALAWVTRSLALARNARLAPRSTVQSATGIRAPRVVQTSMGMTGGSFNTREFFHGASQRFYRNAKRIFLVLTFAVPIALLAWGLAADSRIACVLAFPLQYAGLIAERWFFFAQARHPQNLYYQTVS